MDLKINLHITKKILIVTALLLATVVISALYFKAASSNPLPKAIKDQVSFKVAYPAGRTAPIQQNSYKYESQKNTLAFKARYAGSDITFTEQPAPDSLGSEDQIYYPALGIHPYAQFKTDLGPVALTKFWQSGSLKPVGQAAVLATQGTLVTAHSDKSLTNQQWKELFESMKIAR